MNEALAGRQAGRVESALRVRLNAGCVLFWLTDFLIVMLQRAKQCKAEAGGVATVHTMAIKCISLSDQRHARRGPHQHLLFAFAFAVAAAVAAFGLTQSSAG